MAREKARRDEDKAARRREIVDVARELLRASSYADVKMADVATQSGIAKGTVFLYFPTKEALFLAVLEDLLGAWLDVLEGALDEGGRWSTRRVARTIAATLGEHEDLVDLLAVLSSVLERNADVEDVARFKTFLLDRLGRAGAALERRLPFLVPGEGARAFLHIDAVVIGLHQLASPGPIAEEALRRPALAPLAVDFRAELTHVLEALFTGLETTRKDRT